MLIIDLSFHDLKSSRIRFIHKWWTLAVLLASACCSYRHFLPKQSRHLLFCSIAVVCQLPVFQGAFCVAINVLFDPAIWDWVDRRSMIIGQGIFCMTEETPLLGRPEWNVLTPERFKILVTFSAKVHKIDVSLEGRYNRSKAHLNDDCNSKP